MEKLHSPYYNYSEVINRKLPKEGKSINDIPKALLVAQNVKTPIK